jgi:outer membrane protein assembly factor BamB
MKPEINYPQRPSWVRASAARAIAPAIILFSVLFFACSAYGQSVPGFQAPDKPKVQDDTPIAVKAARGEVPFSQMYGHLKLDSAKTKRLGQLSASEQKRKNKDSKFLRIGVVRPLISPLDPIADSTLYKVAEGDIRVAGVTSEGAVAVRVQFNSMSLPPGARVFVYSPTNPSEYYGPYIGRGTSEDGTFWTPPIQGDTAIIEYFTPANTKLARIPFKVSSIAHIYRDMSFEKGAAGFCELEVTADWQNVAKSVGRVDFVSGGSVGSCTGTLLNNAANDQKPYFLTANHCISTQSEASSVTVYWNYNTGDNPPGGTPTTNGSNLLVTGASSDFTLLFLTGSLPGGLFFSGWDSAAFNSTAPGTAIHHPNSSHKRISFGTARQPLSGNCLPGEQCLRVDWTSGVTEPGSSGSGIWIGSPSDPGGPRLIGTLTGGPSFCGASASDLWDVYGRFSVTYTSISSFLEGQACVTSLSSTSQTFPGSGGTGSFNVVAAGGCNWTAVPSDSFVTITSGSNGSGNGTVNFSVAANSGPQRSATIVVGGKVFTINQNGGGACAPSPISIGQTVNGNLTTGDCPLGDGTFYDPYSFTATAGQQVAISMTSSQFDTFLILNRPDGSVLSVDDDGGGGTNSRIPGGAGFITLPVSGTYTIWANAFSPSNTTGSYSLTLSAPAPRTLTVASSNPNSGIVVSVSPSDNNGLSNGTTPFTRTYNEFTTVTLNAPGSAAGGLIFLKWQKDGVDSSTSPVTSVTMDFNHTMTAVYGPPPTFTLTVASSNPSSGVPISVAPNDNGGLGNGTTQFTRTYNQFTQVNLNAPINGGGNSYFLKWQRDGIDLTTNRSTNVIASTNQTLTAVYTTLPPPPTPIPTPTPTSPGQAVAYQIDPAHTGSQFDPTVSTPLTQRWSRNLGSAVSYPLIAGNKVFVLAGVMLHALNAQNGATLWGPIEVGVSRGLAYESNRVFAINFNGLLRAYDASTGTQLWTRQLSGQAFTSPPTAMGGTVYVGGVSTLYAVNASDGTVKWSVPNAGGDQSAPAVTTNALYVSYSCNNAWAIGPAAGNVIWHYTSSCFGGGGKTPVYYNGRVYIRDTGLENLAFDAAVGLPVASIPAGPAPAFHGSTGFYLNVNIISTLEARDISTNAVKWTFTGDGTLSSAPIIVNGTVYIGSTSGKLYALDENTGANIWTGVVGSPVNRPDEQNLSEPLIGLGAGEGLLVVPASSSVVAYQSDVATTPPVIYVQEGTNNAVALDSVTFIQAPFRVSNEHNFSSDQRTRIIILTSYLGLKQSDLSDPTALVVELGGVNLPVENVGTLSILGLNSSYIVVRLPDNVPTGLQELKVKLRGVTSEVKMLNILP